MPHLLFRFLAAAIALAGAGYSASPNPEPTAPPRLGAILEDRQQQPFSINSFIPEAPATDYLTGSGTQLGYKPGVNSDYLARVTATDLTGGATTTQDAQLALATGKVGNVDELSVVFAPALRKQISDLADANLKKRNLEERDAASLAVALVALLGSQSLPSLLGIVKPAAFSIAQYGSRLIRFGPITLALGAFIDNVVNAVTLSHNYPGGIPPSVKVPLGIALGTKSCTDAPRCNQCGGSDQFLYCKTGDYASCVGFVNQYVDGFLQKQFDAMDSNTGPGSQSGVNFFVVFVTGPATGPQSQQLLVVPTKKFGDPCDIAKNPQNYGGTGATIVNTLPASIPATPSRMFDMTDVTIKPGTSGKLCGLTGLTLTFSSGNGKTIAWSDKSPLGATGGQCDILDKQSQTASSTCDDGTQAKPVVQRVFACRSTQNPSYCAS
ncbi:MAG: hypothetical protein M1839_004002 [Geoglossum umbratile]|nr:MAG: hypothetical protein M1839_004002 [Geoglossum umbratile]